MLYTYAITLYRERNNFLRRGEGALEPDIPRACSNADTKLSTRHNPVLGASIPVAEILAAEVECRGALGAWCQLQLGEATQLLWRRSRGRRGEGDVELGNFCTLNTA